ncbi:hypothetical protein WJX72_008490 [[Myrmecia] bisecta]|uniref:DNA-directed RNA polymerase II subunit RPB7 n=1 Tax=[Myrmecia] bisecta TaxID=41462 RepID=A0AAW1P408_9CHLO
MFFVLELDKEIELPPRFFGPRLRETLEQKLHSEVEGTCSGAYGFIICVVSTESVSKGIIREGTGSASFNVKYKCVVFRPFRGEVLDAVVTQVNKVGFFAEAGPLQIFVSSHLIPEDFELTTADEPSFVSADGEVRIQLGSEVRLRVVGTRIDASDIFCVGTIKEDYLGVIGDPQA